MKKLFFLFALLGLISLPMFASDITFGGDLTYGAISDFDNNEGESTTVNFDIKATVDDHNSLKIEADIDNNELDKAYVTTNIGTWLELPIGLKLDWGLIKPNANRFMGVSERGNEKCFNFEKLYWGLNLLATIDIIEIELAFDPGEAVSIPVDDDGNPLDPVHETGVLLIGIAAKEPIPGLNAEVYYYQNDKESDVLDNGDIGIDASYATEISGFALKAGVGFKYSLLTEEQKDAEEDSFAYGVGLKGTYSIATLTVGLDGNETDALAGLTATIAVSPVDMATIYAGLEMDLTEAAADDVDDELRDSSLDGIDAGIQIKMGATSLYIGYLLTDVGSGKWKAPTTMTYVDDDGETQKTGGAYLKLDIDY